MKQKSEKTVVEWLKGVDEKDGRNLIVYETRKPEVQPEMLSELAKRLGIDGKIQSEEDVQLISHGKQVLGTYKDTGAFWYADFSKLRQPSYLPKLPAEKDAMRIAEEFLKKNDWLPKSAIFDGVHQTVFERVEGKKREKRTKHPNNVCVQYRCSYNQLKTYGPGAKIKVFIGEGGEVIGLFHAMPEPHVYAEFPTLSKKELEDTLQRKLGVSLN